MVRIFILIKGLKLGPARDVPHSLHLNVSSQERHAFQTQVFSLLTLLKLVTLEGGWPCLF